MSCRWCSATPAPGRRPVLPSRATRPRGRNGSAASSWSTRRAKTSSPGFAHRSRSRSSSSSCPTPTRSSAPRWTTLERHYRDVQDVEFTIEQGKLYILQTRSAKRTTAAALKAAVDMVARRADLPDEAVLRIEPSSLDHVLHPMVDPEAEVTVAGVGRTGLARRRRRRGRLRPGCGGGTKRARAA